MVHCQHAYSVLVNMRIPSLVSGRYPLRGVAENKGAFRIETLPQCVDFPSSYFHDHLTTVL